LSHTFPMPQRTSLRRAAHEGRALSIESEAGQPGGRV
jgi:hypothetical protein